MSILTDIWKWLTKAAVKIKVALTQGSTIANEVKAVVNSPLLDIAVSLTTTNLDDKALEYVRKGLAQFIVTMGWAEKLIQDFEADADAKAAALTAISAKASVLVAELNGTKLSIQQALASAPVVYRPEILK